MQGSLRQRSIGSWELRVFIGLDPTTKRRRYRSMTVRGSRADAERELAAMVAAAQAARAVGVRSTVGELLQAWFAVAATGWAPTTTRQTRSVLDRYLHPHLGRVAVGDVTPAMIDATYATLRHGGGVKGPPVGGGNTDPGACRAARRVRAGDALGMDLGQPRRARPPYRPRHRRAASSDPGRAAHPIDHVAERDPQLHPSLVLAATTGGRRAQLLGLRWHNVHLAVRRVSFTAGWVEGPDRPVLAATKTKRRHVVDLDPATFDVLVDWPPKAAVGLSRTRSCSATTAV